MSEQAARTLLTSLRRAMSHMRLYGPDHRLTEAACHETAAAAGDLCTDRGRAVLMIVDDTLYLDRTVLAMVSLEFNGLIRDLQDAGVESITLTRPVHDADVAALVSAVIAGGGDEGRTSGSALLNESPWSRHELDGSETAGLRSSYTASLDVLRRAGKALRSNRNLDVIGAASAVRSLLEQTLSQPNAALLLASVKSHHEYTFYHSVNTCILSLALGRFTGLPDQDLVLLGTGALLHDIGKVGVSKAILQHPGRLTEEQWREIRRHPQTGAEAILTSAPTGQEVAAIVAFEHHARFDGSGYPRLVYDDHTHDGNGHHHHRGPQHFFSRLVAVADTYDAITTRRAYRRAEPPAHALHVLLNGAGSSYDPDFVMAFIHMMGVYPPGSFLRLRTGHIAMVTEPSPGVEAPPPSVVIADSAGTPIPDPVPVRLRSNDIVEQVSPAAIAIDPAAVLERVGVGDAGSA
jgi:HD-GYP domain-containing protein (c-di-GMP phosphodiesterase class II)